MVLNEEYRTYATFLDSSVPESKKVYEIETSFKMALLRLPRLVISDSQSIDNKAFQILLLNEDFRRAINFKTSLGPSMEINLRSNVGSIEDVVRYWLDFEGNRDNVKLIESENASVNKEIEKQHENRTLSFSSLEKIIPEFYAHLKRIETVGPACYQTGHPLRTNYHDIMMKTLKELTVVSTNSEIKTMCKRLISRWQNNTNWQRSEFLKDIRTFKEEKNLSENLQKNLDGLQTFCYQIQYSEITDGKIVTGKEAERWVIQDNLVHTETMFKMPKKMPKHRFIKELDWDGIFEIRTHKEFVSAMARVQAASRSGTLSEYVDSVSNYFDTFTNSYKSLSQKGKAPDPHYLQNGVISMVRYGLKAAGVCLGNLCASNGIPFGNIVGDVVAEIAEANTIGFIIQNENFVNTDFKQLRIDLATQS